MAESNGLRDYLFDIGANEGQFALAAGEVWPRAEILSFEPLPDCYERLRDRLRHRSVFRAFNVGLGDERGDVVFSERVLRLVVISSNGIDAQEGVTHIHKIAAGWPRKSSGWIVSGRPLAFAPL